MAPPRAGQPVPRHRGPARHRRRAEPVRDSCVAQGPRVGRRRAGSERADRHGRGRRPHSRDPRRGSGRPRGRRPARQDQGLRLRLHHVHPDAAAARGGGPAAGGDVRGRPVIEGLRARRARHPPPSTLAPLRPLSATTSAPCAWHALHGLWGPSSRCVRALRRVRRELIEPQSSLDLYGVLLGLFLVAFFPARERSAVFSRRWSSRPRYRDVLLAHDRYPLDNLIGFAACIPDVARAVLPPRAAGAR